MKARGPFARGLITAMAVWGFPATVFACPVCFAAKDEANRVAFVASTVFLTALPLLLMGAFIGWAARRAKALDVAACDSERAPSAVRLDAIDAEAAVAEPSRVVSLAPADSARG